MGFWRSVDATGDGKGCRLEGQISSGMEVPLTTRNPGVRVRKERTKEGAEQWDTLVTSDGGISKGSLGKVSFPSLRQRSLKRIHEG